LRKQSSRRDREKGPKLLTLGQLNSVWDGILKDDEGRAALGQLKQAGFNIEYLRPQDSTFKNPSWADYVAAIPLLENRPSRTHFHSSVSLRKHLALVPVLRNFARQFDDPFCTKTLASTRDADLSHLEGLPDLADGAASFIESFLSWDWSVRERNPRNALIAELRWTIRDRTGKTHDREFSALIDAACRSAGRPELCLDNSTLDRIEKREKEIRVKSMRRLNSQARSSLPLKSKSTRNPKTRR
jgi:hypothetical protein